jgi:hypothetical protein
MSLLTRTFLFIAPLISLLLTSCASTDVSPQLETRRMAIASEPPGDYYIGRRFTIERTHFWGYLRRPQQPWAESKLVVMGERMQKTPDRLPEMATAQAPPMASITIRSIASGATTRVAKSTTPTAT